MLVTGTGADTRGTKHHHRCREGGMGTACSLKDTPIRSSVRTFRRIVPEKTPPSQEVSDGIRKVLRRPPSPRK